MTVSLKEMQVIAEPAPSTLKIMKVRQAKYTLDELLEGYDTDSSRSPEEQAWINAPAVENEVW